LRILVCFVVVNRGEVVVNCVVNRVNCVVFFGVEKHATFLDLFLRVSYFGNAARAATPAHAGQGTQVDAISLSSARGSLDGL
jgi:hypothetical protein